LVVVAAQEIQPRFLPAVVVALEDTVPESLLLQLTVQYMSSL
jgi:hypothetical protein